MNTLSSFAPVTCPVCNSLCSDPPLYSYSVSEAAAYFCPVSRNSDRHRRFKACIHKLWQGEDCTIRRCKECGFSFGYPFVGGDEEFYSILHEQKDYPSWRWDYDIAIREALTWFSGGNILEIGAGKGAFLTHLGKEWKCYAMEGSESTREPLEAAGIQVFRDFSEVALSEAGNFQVIALFQVLEHIAEFHAVLAQCYQLLCPDGRLFITVPDGDAMIRQTKITGCPDMPPNHINKWTPESLSRALRTAGFSPEKVIFEPASWQNFKTSLYLKVISDASKPRSLAAQVYRIPNKRLRAPLLASLGLPALLSMFPYLRQLGQGGTLAMVGVRS